MGAFSRFFNDEHGGAKIVDSTKEAFGHYFNGNGESAHLGPNTRDSIINSRDQQYRSDRIRTGQTSSLSGDYGVNVEGDMYYVGDTPVSYDTQCSNNGCTTTYTNQGDGFWDPVIDMDGPGPAGEIPGGTPYHFKPFKWQETYPNPYQTNLVN